MASVIRGEQDQNIQAILTALDDYESRFPQSEAAVYRQNPGAVRVRIIDDRFAGMPKSRRHDDVWRFLSERLGDDVMSEISELLLLGVAELKSSLANLEFEDPLPSSVSWTRFRVSPATFID